MSYIGKHICNVLKTFNKCGVLKLGMKKKNEQPLIELISSSKKKMVDINEVCQANCKHCNMTCIGETWRQFIYGKT